MWFSEYLFLERSWAKDEITLKVRHLCCTLYWIFHYALEFYKLISVLHILISFESHVIVSTVRSFTVEGLPFAFLVGTFCRRDSIYRDETFSS